MGVEDNDDIEFSQHLAERRHKELVSAIKDIKIPDHDDSGLAKAISDGHTALKGHIEKIISSIPKPETPQVNVNTDNSELLKILNKIHEKLCEQKPEVKKPEWEIEIKRSHGGLIQSFTARQK